MKRGRANSTSGSRKRRRSSSNFTVVVSPEARALQQSRALIAMSRKASGRVENKVTQYAISGSITNSGAVYQILSNMTRGTSPKDEYIGNEILPTSLRCQYSWTMGPTAGVGDGTNIVRVIIFQWYDAVIPTVPGVLQTVAPLSNYLWNNIENLSILSDKVYALKQYGGSATGYDAIVDKVYIKGKKMQPIKFNTTTAVPQKGGIYAIVLSDSVIPPAPYIDFYCQVTFTDS